MYPTTEELTAWSKAGFDAATRAASITLDAFERVSAIQLAALKSAFADGVSQAQAYAAAPDLQAYAQLRTAGTRAAAEKTAAWFKAMYDAGVQTQSAFSVLAEDKLAEFTTQATATFDTLAKSAPAGSEAAVAAAKSAMSAVNTGYDNFAKSLKQFVELAQANVEAASAAAKKVA